MKKRILSILLAMVMCMTLLPTVAMADGTKVAEIIGGTQYETLAEAVANATDGAIIKLLSDVNTAKQIEISGKEITLNMNGKKIEYTGSSSLSSGVLLVHNGAGLTVTGNGTIKSGDKAYAAIALTKKGDDDSKPAKLTILNGIFEGFYYGIVGNGTRHNTVITINGGTFKGTNTNEEGSVAIFHPQSGKLTINGGIFEGLCSAVEMRAGELTINGGTFTATTNTYNAQKNGSGNTISGAAIALSQHTTNKPLSAIINGGTFTGLKAFDEVDLEDENSNVSAKINGGMFKGKVESKNITEFITGGMFVGAKKEDLANYFIKGFDIDPNTGIVYSPAKVEQTVKTAVVVAVGVATAAVVTKVVVDKLHEVKAAKAAAAEAEKAAKLAEMPTVAIGDSGDAVTTLQTELNAQGFNCGEADGFFGQNTHDAVIAFQTAEGLTADGVVGAQTWAALL